MILLSAFVSTFFCESVCLPSWLSVSARPSALFHVLLHIYREKTRQIIAISCYFWVYQLQCLTTHIIPNTLLYRIIILLFLGLPTGVSSFADSKHPWVSHILAFMGSQTRVCVFRCMFQTPLRVAYPITEGFTNWDTSSNACSKHPCVWWRCIKTLSPTTDCPVDWHYSRNPNF